MSTKNNFRVSINQLFGHSIIFLLGTLLAAIFIHLTPQNLQDEFFKRFTDYYVFSGFISSVMLILQEFCWVLVIAFFSYIPHGRIANFFVLLYKGFSVGIISSIACHQLSLSGIKYTLFLVLPPNLFYILSLCIASQISFEIALTRQQKSCKHAKAVYTNKSAYFICIILTIIGALLETYFAPWLHNILF